MIYKRKQKVKPQTSSGILRLNMKADLQHEKYTFLLNLKRELWNFSIYNEKLMMIQYRDNGKNFFGIPQIDLICQNENKYFPTK